HELPERVSLLAVEHSLMLDGSVTPPVAHCRQPVVDNSISNRPMFQDNWLQRLDPRDSAGRHGTAGFANGLADRHEMGVPGKAHVDSLDRVPELVESRVKIEIRPARYATNQLPVGEHSRYIDQEVSPLSHGAHLGVSHWHRLLRSRDEQRRRPFQSE